MRIFQNAAYIQNLEAGLHQVHVQGEGVETWVKVLPVYAHLVTEARSFTLPRRPQVRWVSEYLTPSGASVVTPGATSTLAFASTTNIFFASSTVATSTLERNIEYTFVESLFASTTAARADLAEQLRLQAERFRFGSGTSTLATTTATTTKEFRDVRLYQAGDDVYAQWLGSENDRPHYYCVNYRGEEAMRLAYGSHVLESLRWQLGTSTDLTDPELVGQRLCRDTIRIDRIGQSVQHFDFLPGSEHHVLMHLQDGVYVVEVDDRSWQNVQLLYPGDYLQVVVNEGQIFILDDERYLQVYPELQE